MSNEISIKITELVCITIGQSKRKAPLFGIQTELLFIQNCLSFFQPNKTLRNPIAWK